MVISDWIRSNIEYGRDLVNGGFQGARSTTEASLAGDSLSAYLSRSALKSWMPTAVGAYIGLLGAAVATRRRPAYGAVALSGLLGGAIGFVSGMAWGTRHLTEEVTREAMKNIGAVRDERWLSRNPIDYA
jgi:hypothetical protein